MVSPQMGTNPIRPWLIRHETEPVLNPEVLKHLDMLHWGYRPYPRDEKPKYMQRTSGNSQYVGKTVALFHTFTDDAYSFGAIAGISYAGDLGNATVSFDTSEEGAAFFRDHLFVENEKQNWILVPHGAKRYINLLRTTYVNYWMQDGYVITILPTSAGSAIIIVKKGKSSWALVDYAQHTTREPEDVDGYVDDIQSGTVDLLLIATRLLDFTLCYEAALKTYFGINPSLTYASTGTQLAKKFYQPNSKAWRPTALMSHWLRGDGSPLGGYVNAIPYKGKGFEVDQRRAYSTYMAEPIPWKFGMGYPIKDGVFRPGIYLSTITVDTNRSVYLRAWNEEGMYWSNSHHSSGTHYAIIPSVEFAGLRARGCTIEPHYGWVATDWFSMRTLVEAAEEVINHAGEKSFFTKILKVMVNAITGKCAANPVMNEVLLSAEHPGEGWQICVDGLYQEIEGNWYRQIENHKPYMNVAVAEWIYAAQRNAVYLFLAAQQEMGNYMVSWSVDGGLMTGTPCPDMPTQSSVRGTFILKNSNSDIQVFANNYNTVNGITKHAGTAKYTSQETRLVLINLPALVPEAAPPKVYNVNYPWAALVEGKYKRPDLAKENRPRNWHNMPTDVYWAEICKLYGPVTLQPTGL